jgi:hypothetical protein
MQLVSEERSDHNQSLRDLPPVPKSSPSRESSGISAIPAALLSQDLSRPLGRLR